GTMHPCGGQRHSPGGRDPRPNGKVAAPPAPTQWRQGPDGRAQHLPCPYHAHTMIIAIGNVDIALRVYVTPVRPVQPGSRCRPAIALTTLMAPGNGGDHTCRRINAADGMVLRINHYQVIVMVAAYSLRGSPGGCKGWSTVAVIATLASAGVGGHDAVG